MQIVLIRTKADLYGMEDVDVDMRVAIYCRVGNPDQAESGALERQKTELLQYCKAQGYEVVDVLMEVRKSYEYPSIKIKQAMELIKTNQIEGIVVTDISKISRNFDSYSHFNDFVCKHGGKLVEPKQGVIDYAKIKLPVYERKPR